MPHSLPNGEPAHRLLGLTDDEYDMIIAVLGREPNGVELAMYSVMWSEHCSYKSSRVHLGRLPSEGERVIIGPGENAGVVDVGDGIAVALRIESHNHPSAVEPYQGAATGVGGILRDIFTMGARPIAIMDALFTGPLDDPRSRYLLDGIVRGVSGYGNSVGVPTIGGSLTFDECYAGNPLVNVFCLGVLPVDRLVLGRASGTGNLAVLLGSATGRDGIGGVSVLASAGFGSANTGSIEAAKRPSVQVGDPYEEKRLIEACLELLSSHLVVAIQDLGGAGLACATSELAARGGVAMDVDISAIPLREAGMTAAEIMTSESQERMLAIVTPSDLDQVLQVCQRFEVSAAVIGLITPVVDGEAGRLRILDRMGGEVLADVPAKSIADDAPRYERPLAAPALSKQGRVRSATNDLDKTNCSDDFLTLLVDPSFVYQQYDHQLFANTVRGPGEADAAVLELAAPDIMWKNKALALSVDANPTWCAIDPRFGAAATVSESALNVACTGAKPIALVNCLNFGNPEHPEVMWQLSEAIDGIAMACKALDLPVVGGNVSLYNESHGTDIDPTPVIAVIGLIDQLSSRPPAISLVDGESLVLLGTTEPCLGGSRYERECHRSQLPGELADLPGLDLVAHRRLVDFLVDSVGSQVGSQNDSTRKPLISGIHDVSGGGLAVALGELAIKAGIGLWVFGVNTIAELFSESPTRVVICTPTPDELVSIATSQDIPASVIAIAGGNRLVVDGLLDLSLEEITASFAQKVPQAMQAARRTN